MAICELFCSGPGTGKTSHCIDLFRKEILKSKGGLQSRSFFVLPNREHAERIQNLTLKKDVSGLFNAHILTIKDLTSYLLGPVAGRHPNDALRLSVLSEIFEDPSFKWQYFDSVKHSFGFRKLMADVLKEFSAALVTTEELEKHAQGLLKDSVFRAKFRDFSVVAKEYEARLAALGFREPESDIRELGREAKRNAKSIELVIFDGFYHFSRAQEELIRAVSSMAQSVVVTLTLPAGVARPALFYYPEKTRKFLKNIGFKEREAAGIENYRSPSAALLHLEQQMFNQEPEAFKGDEKSIEIIEAPSKRAEIEMIAREIKKLYRENKFHYSDICVILRSLSGYEEVIEQIFKDFEIPAAVHERKKMIEHGFTATLWRFLNLIKEDWQREDVLYVLKSSFLKNRVSFEAVQSLERYAFSHNIAHGKLLWSTASEAADFPKNAREALKNLFEWEKRVSTAKNLAQAVRFLAEWVRSFEADFPDAMDQLVFGTLERLFEAELEKPATEETWSAVIFAKHFEETLEAALFSVKAESKNRVQVYDVVMALPKEYKAVFLAGLLQSQFPQSITQDPLFSDAERKSLNRGTLILEERAWRESGERYFFYMACARAKEKLYFSYPSHDADGRGTLPSFFIEEAKKCFEGGLPVRKKALDELVPGPDEWESEMELARGMTALQPEFPVPGKAVIRDPKIQAFFQSIEGPFSATKLELYATCSFKYFANRVLSLSTPDESREFRIMGDMLHKTLERFYRAHPDGWKDTAKATKELITEFEKIWAEEKRLNFEPLYRQKIQRAEMLRILGRFLTREKESFEKRSLSPAYFELNFGNSKKSELGLGPLKIEDGARPILIEGQIDRIDLDKNDPKKALVMDYKRSKRAVSIDKKLEKGTEFQLPIYILAARELLGLDVLAAELRPLKEGALEGLYRDLSRDALGLGPKKRTRSDEEWFGILEESKNRIRSTVAKLRSAGIETNPKTCDHCEYNPVCRFEKSQLTFLEYEKNKNADNA